jgi:hypothetical protein
MKKFESFDVFSDEMMIEKESEEGKLQFSQQEMKRKQHGKYRGR